jgi:integrase
MNYTPEIDAYQWAQIEPFVTSIVTDADGLTPYRSRDLMSSVSRFVLWTWKSAGLPLERDVLLRREVIARYIEAGSPTLGLAARGNARSQLLRIAEALLDSRRAHARLKPLPASDPARPYSRQELSALVSWADHQSTADRRLNAQVLLALGAGAGLSTSEIGQLRVDQIDISADGVTVHILVGRLRSVPVICEWEEALRSRKETTPGGLFAFRPSHTVMYPNLISNFVDRSDVGDVRAHSQRLRSTWLVRQLDAGTPVVALMEAAGLESLEALTRYLRFVSTADEQNSHNQLRHA